MPKTKEVKRTEAIARNEKHRSKYEKEYFKANPSVKPDSSAGKLEAKAYADQKIGIPSGRPKKVKTKRVVN